MTAFAMISGSTALACSPLPKGVADGVGRRLCPISSTDVSELLGKLGGAGNTDPMMAYMLRFLNGLEGLPPGAPDPNSERRFMDILQGNDNVRNGLRAIIVKATFTDRQLAKWCGWRAAGMPQGSRSSAVAAVEEAVTCGAS